MAELTASVDPLRAPLWRKLLALRVFALCAVGLVVSFYLIGWLDETKPDVPKWVMKSMAVILLGPILAMFFALKLGIEDLVVHFLPEGRIRRLLLWGDTKPEAIAADFGKTGYMWALLPFIIPLVLGAILFVLLLLFGGFALVSAMFASLFAGWPPWAIVIAFLLVLILLKK